MRAYPPALIGVTGALSEVGTMMNDEAHRDDITIEAEATAQYVRPGLAINRMVPDFMLETVEGRTISPLDFKERKNLVIIFFNPRSSEDLSVLAELRRRYHEFADSNAEVLAIASGSTDELCETTTALRLQFPILADVRMEATCAYCVAGTTMFVADKYGELKMQSDLTKNVDETLDEALSTIELAELECPECGVSTWPID